ARSFVNKNSPENNNKRDHVDPRRFLQPASSQPHPYYLKHLHAGGKKIEFALKIGRMPGDTNPQIALRFKNTGQKNQFVQDEIQHVNSDEYHDEHQYCHHNNYYN
ncbi:unnamed protein product, partial [Amoebophrya sp. A120]